MRDDHDPRTPTMPSPRGGTRPKLIRLWPREEIGESPVLRDVIAHWNGLRGGAALPECLDMDAGRIGPAPEQCFILERTRPGVLRFRFCGAHLGEVAGMELRGMPFRVLFDLSARQRAVAMLETAFLGPSALDLGLVSLCRDRSALSGRMILLPLGDGHGVIDRALGVLVTKGAIGFTPRRFQIEHSVLTPLVAGRPFALALGEARRDEPSASIHQGAPRVFRVVQGGRA